MASPALVNPPAPFTAPLKVTALTVVSAVSAVNATLPLTIKAPVLFASPSATALESASVFAKVRACVPMLLKVPPLIVRLPDPSAMSLPTCRNPLLRFTPPPNVLEPLNASIPSALFTKEPLPAITPVKEPSESVSAVPFKFRTPPPLRVANV